MKLVFNLHTTHTDQSYFDLKTIPFYIGQKVRFNAEFHQQFNPGHRVDIITDLKMNKESTYFPPNVIARLKKLDSTVDLSWLIRYAEYKKL